jgi:hypothetical protein
VIKTIRGLPYLSAGLSLFALKVFFDSLVARSFGRPFSLLFYISPLDSPLVNPGQDRAYWLTLWSVALPFIAVGLTLTLWRLRDAGRPLGLALLFFIPFGNLVFFLIASLLPSKFKGDPTLDGAGLDRPTGLPRYGVFSAACIAGVTGGLIGLAGVAISFAGIPVYGAALFLGSPVMSGFISALLFCHLHAPLRRGIILSTTLALLLGAVVAMTLALEGILCLLMAAPLVILGSFLGAYLGTQCFKTSSGGQGVAAGAALLVLPLTLFVEHLNPLPTAPAAAVESSLIVHAPPEVVWKYVIQFPPMPPAREWIFKAGIAAPLSASISGKGPGALRRCHFTTGDFMEPIEVWRDNQELTFSVEQMPDPMRELTFWDGPRPPHLDGFLQTTRGQFLLDPLPGGKTRLTGTTWYRTNMVPEIYWRLWANLIIHRIHGRVLEHVAHLAESHGGSSF